MNRGVNGENENAQSSKRQQRGIRTRAHSIASPAFYHRAPRDTCMVGPIFHQLQRSVSKCPRHTLLHPTCQQPQAQLFVSSRQQQLPKACMHQDNDNQHRGPWWSLYIYHSCCRMQLARSMMCPSKPCQTIESNKHAHVNGRREILK